MAKHKLPKTDINSQSDQPVLKWNTQVLRTGSSQNGPAHGSELLSSHALVGQSMGIQRDCCGKMCVCVCVPWTFSLKLARTNSFGPARLDKGKAT